MKITGNSGLGAMAQVGKVKPMNTVAKEQATSQEVAQFDKIAFSAHTKLEGDSKIQQEVASKIPNEVRTHNTTSKIAELKEQFQSGTYQMDARDTAARMLLMGAVE